ncbi:MAG: hypothetical protein LBE34_06835 [Flavobacteriaceae bacterium]|jgi:hypothetical protein|nr:hypothetical protein [Flavobacteriaceae bacterium]
MKRKHIGVWLSILGIISFSIPTLSNILHYVVIEHNFGHRSSKLEWVDAKNIHYCEQYLCKFSPAIETPVMVFSAVVVGCVIVYYNVQVASYKEQFSSFFWSRGPPGSVDFKSSFCK